MRTTVPHQILATVSTGETRYLPWTQMDVVIPTVAGLAATIALVVSNGTGAVVTASIVCTGGLAIVWALGYLGSGPPWLPVHHGPDWLQGAVANHSSLRLRAAGSGGDGTTGGDGDGEPPAETDEGGNQNSTGRTEAEAWLSAARVIVPCEGGNDLCLDEQFRISWYERMHTIRGEETMRTELAQEFDLSPTEIEFDEQDNAFVARNESRDIGQWRSRAAMVADVAAARELPDWVDGWEDLSSGLRSKLLLTLRVFVDECPRCDASVRIGEDTVESDEESIEVFAGTCEGCGDRLFERPMPESA